MNGAEGPPVASPARAERDRSERRLRALSEIGRVGVAPPRQDAPRRILLAAMAAMEADSASLGVWDEAARLLRVRYNVGELADWEEPEPADEAYEADQSTWLAEMSDGLLGAVLNLDDPDLADDDREYLELLGKHSSISVPILYAGSWWGELFIARNTDRQAFTESDLEWSTAVAAQLGAALETLDHLSRIGRLAQTDPLTGLANRRALDEWLDLATVELRENQQPIGLVVCDLNGLKTINDQQGHDAGDRALVHFSQLLLKAQGSLQGSIVARLGGDEFCLAVSGSDVTRLHDSAVEICRDGWNSLPYGIACGMVSTAESIGPIDNAARLFRLADAAQYRAKRTRSDVPVVAGRRLPPELAVPIVEPSDDVAPDRRLLRGRQEGGQSHLLEAALRALDQAASEAVSNRLGVVADLMTHHIDGVGWWLSFAASGADEMRTAEFAIYRAIPGITEDELKTELGSAFPLDTYPQTAAAMRGGGFTVNSSDLTADPAELAILDGLRATSVVAAGGTDPEGDRWLIEIFTDELSAAPAELPSALRLLVLAALHPPAQP